MEAIRVLGWPAEPGCPFAEAGWGVPRGSQSSIIYQSPLPHSSGLAGSKPILWKGTRDKLENLDFVLDPVLDHLFTSCLYLFWRLG